MRRLPRRRPGELRWGGGGARPSAADEGGRTGLGRRDDHRGDRDGLRRAVDLLAACFPCSASDEAVHVRGVEATFVATRNLLPVQLDVDESVAAQKFAYLASFRLSVHRLEENEQEGAVSVGSKFNVIARL